MSWERSALGRFTGGGPVRTAVVVFLASRLAMLAGIVVAAAIHHGVGDRTGLDLGASLGAALGKSDGVWYLGIAHHGYGPPPPIGPDGVYTHLTSLAFFPLYPLLIRAVAFTGLPYLGAALVVTALAGVVAAALIAAWARPLVGERGAVTLVALWSLLPSAAVFNLAYSEALFVAAAAWCLLALQRRQWASAGLAASVAGLTRPTGAALVLAVFVAVALDTWHNRRVTRPGVAGVLLAPVGFIAVIWHVAVVTHRWDGWFWLERTVWRSGSDGGRSALDHFGQLVTGGRAAHRLPEIVAAGVLVAAVVLMVVAWRRHRLRCGDQAFSVATVVLAVIERGYFYVKPRLLLVAFPLLIPVVGPVTRLAAAGRRRWFAAAALLTAASVVYNAYLVVVWPKAL